MPRSLAAARIALGFDLAVRGLASLTAATLAGIALILGLAFTVRVSARNQELLERVPGFAGSGLAWGFGILVAFGAAARCVRRDRDEGIVALMCSRGGSLTDYLVARVAGIALAVGAIVVPGTLIAGGTAILLSHQPALRLDTLRAAAAAVVHGIAFSLVVAPVAMAALGARSRKGGYVALMLVLVAPELLHPWFVRVLPGAWADVSSVSGALTTTRTSLLQETWSPEAFLRASIVLIALAIGSFFVARAEVSFLNAEGRR